MGEVTKNQYRGFANLKGVLARKRGGGLIPQCTLWNDGGLNTLCHSCVFACQQRVLETFPGPGYLRSKDGVV